MRTPSSEDLVSRILAGDDVEQVLESAATPMPRLGVLATAKTMSASLKPGSSASSAPKLGGQIPKLKTMATEARDIIARVARGESVKDVI